MYLLDGLVRYRFGDNAELIGAWIITCRAATGVIVLVAGLAEA
jgi:hypothetical protein